MTSISGLYTCRGNLHNLDYFASTAKISVFISVISWSETQNQAKVLPCSKVLFSSPQSGCMRGADCKLSCWIDAALHAWVTQLLPLPLVAILRVLLKWGVFRCFHDFSLLKMEIAGLSESVLNPVDYSQIQALTVMTLGCCNGRHVGREVLIVPVWIMFCWRVTQCLCFQLWMSPPLPLSSVARALCSHGNPV